MSDGNGVFSDYLCPRQGQLLAVFIIGCLGIVGTVISFQFAELNEATRIVSFLNLTGAGVIVVGSGVVLWKCARME